MENKKFHKKLLFYTLFVLIFASDIISFLKYFLINGSGQMDIVIKKMKYFEILNFDK